MEFFIELSSRYSENFNYTRPPLNLVEPSFGITSINSGGITSLSPPGGAITASQDTRISNI